MDPIQIGLNTVIEKEVTLGEHVVIGNNVVIYAKTIIGNHVTIHDNAVIGKRPMKAKNSALAQQSEVPVAAIADHCIIGTSSIIYAGARLSNHVFVADLATIRERVRIGENTIVGRGVAIENDCSIGANCKLETNAYITAYSTLEDFVFVAPCVVTTNDNYMGRSKERFKHFKGVTVKKGGRIGANATILPGKVIKEEGAVAAGSVVTRDVESKEVVAGIPAKKLHDLPDDQLLEHS